MENIHLEWMNYSQLPDIAKMAVNVCPYFDEEGKGNVGDILFKLETISNQQARKLCMEKTPDLMEEFSTFEDYHATYRSGDNTDHGDSKYP
ncbi:hypothetical protein POF51_29765 [Brevibacillus sp. AG]|uniref:hypothetical protein n=1 Tax=Brevibacillus sp. AG TaxID=3020891 RepID=UPI00232F01AE|nr:hypothetical protein [Brevibacillus sp. AG]MDC0764912.1 hypothetical protein [Brevibacillus sp. AG]